MKNKLILQILAGAFFLGIIAIALIMVFNTDQGAPADTAGLKLADYFIELGGKAVQCRLCPNRCTLSDGQTGLCRARQNIDGKLYSLVYGKIASAHNDPIEKKPLFHFLPGTMSYSIATAGCNMTCNFCQNWSLSQKGPDEVKSRDMTPGQVVDEAMAAGAKSIAYTYTEPTIFFEFMRDTAKLAHEKGLKNIMHSNGYINPEPLAELIAYLDAANIDLKGMSAKFYAEYTTSGQPDAVKETLITLKQNGVWLEVTNLLIPGGNDSEADMRELAKWIKDNLGSDTPLHFSRFYPTYKLENLIPTPKETLLRAYDIAIDEGLKYVYIGNIETDNGATTFCPDGSIGIKRIGYFIAENNLIGGKCKNNEEIAGVWQ